MYMCVRECSFHIFLQRMQKKCFEIKALPIKCFFPLTKNIVLQLKKFIYEFTNKVDIKVIAFDILSIS